MSAPRLSVDLDGLESFAGNLDGIRTTMNATRTILDGYSGQLGAGEVEDALSSFESNWSQGRGKIDQELDGLAKAARSGVQNFRGVDGQLATDLQNSMSQQTVTN